MPEAMVIEKWEATQRKAGFETSAKSLGAFRKRYGDRQVLFQDSSDFAYVELEHELREALPYIPEDALEALVVSTYNFPGSYRRHPSAREKLDDKDFLTRAEALLYAYYGTDAAPTRVENVFRIGNGRLKRILEEHFDDLHGQRDALTYKSPRSRFPLQKLDARIPAPEIPPGEPVKGERDIWVYFQRLYLPEAKEVVDNLDKGKVVVITAPRGSGKTFNLMRTAQLEAESRTYTALRKSGHFFSKADSVETILRELFRYDSLTLHEGSGSKEALIIDESQVMLLSPDAPHHTRAESTEKYFSRIEVAEEFFKALKEKDGRAVLINAGVNPVHRDYITKAFVSAADKYGLACVEHKMRTTQIPVELAVKHLAFIEAERETIEFVSNPENAAVLNPRMFDNLTGLVRGATLGEVKERLVGASRYWIELMQSGQGNSKAGMIIMLKNLGVLTEHNLREAMEIPDY